MFEMVVFWLADLLSWFVNQPIWNQTSLAGVALVLVALIIAALHMLAMMIQDENLNAEYDEEMVLAEADNVTSIDDHR